MNSSIQYKGDLTENGEVEPFRVVVRDGVHDKAVQQLVDAKGIEVVDDPVLAQGMLIRSATKFLCSEDFKKHPALAKIVRVGVGTDNIDMTSAAEAGVATINTPGASTRAVAQRSLAFMLAWSAKIKEGLNALVSEKWPKGDKETEPVDLSESTLGILGYGRIGKETHKLAGDFFGKVLYSDPRNMAGAVDLPTLMAQSDVLSVHVGGSDEVLTPEMLAMMKPGSLLVNTSRGGVINTKGLLKNLDNGRYAALDVFPVEGQKMFADQDIVQLVRHPNVIATPHTAASDPVTQRKLAEEGADRMKEYGQQGIVNPFDLPGHTLPKFAPQYPHRPGIRGIITHRSVQGVLSQITSIIASHKANISQMINEDSRLNGGTSLAMTSFDVRGENMDTALKIARDLQSNLELFQQRMLVFAGSND